MGKEMMPWKGSSGKERLKNRMIMKYKSAFETIGNPKSKKAGSGTRAAYAAAYRQFRMWEEIWEEPTDEKER